MATIGLSAYTLRLRKRNSHELEWLTMSRGGAVDAFEMLHRHLLDRRNQIVDIRGIASEDHNHKGKPVSKAFKLIDLKADKVEGTFCGLFESGDYGRASAITNIQTGEVVHRKSIEEADMPPFYFRIHVPDGSTTAVVVTQRIGLSGLKSALEVDLKKHFASLDYTVKMGTLTDDDLLEDYLKHGHVEDITVMTHVVPADSRAAIRNTKINGESPRPGTKVEVRLSHKDGFQGALKTATSAFRRKKAVRDLVEVYGLENPEEVSFEVSREDGSRKTFRILHPSEIGIKYDITNDVEYNANNHPTFESIDGLAKKWCSSLMEQVN